MTSFSSCCRRAWIAGLAALGLSGCSATRILDAFIPSDTYAAQADQAYGADPRQRLDLYLPKGKGPWPVAVFFYGGSWNSGDRADYRFVGEALASHGVLAAVADYRLSPQARYPVFVEDCALAVKWVADRAPSLGGDPRRLFVMGHSAGAYNAAMLALDARWLGAVGMRPQQLAGFIGIAGPYDFLPIENPAAQLAFNWPATPADSQPLAHAGRGAPRTLLLAASKDATVNPQRNSAALAHQLRASGVEVQHEQFDGVGHVSIIGALARPLRRLAPVLDRVTRFMGAAAPA